LVRRLRLGLGGIGRFGLGLGLGRVRELGILGALGGRLAVGSTHVGKLGGRRVTRWAAR
jgi:hypothetical protein